MRRQQSKAILLIVTWHYGHKSALFIILYGILTGIYVGCLKHLQQKYMPKEMILSGL